MKPKQTNLFYLKVTDKDLVLSYLLTFSRWWGIFLNNNLYASDTGA